MTFKNELMIKKISIILILISSVILPSAGQYKTLHDFSARTIDGELFDFSILKGKKVLVVNTATECTLSSQIKKLQELYEEYGCRNFEIIAFPSNDFGSQEPGSNQQIKAFCTAKYGVTFPLMEKITIKGDDMHPVYRWLTSSKENGTFEGRVTWNFQKFMIDEEGRVVNTLSPVTGPQNRRIREWLQEQ